MGDRLVLGSRFLLVRWSTFPSSIFANRTCSCDQFIKLSKRKLVDYFSSFKCSSSLIPSSQILYDSNVQKAKIITIFYFLLPYEKKKKNYLFFFFFSLKKKKKKKKKKK